MADTQTPLRISQRTTWERLLEQIAARQGETFAIVGKGARARKLLVRLAAELPELELEVYGPKADREFVAFMNRDPARPITYRMPG